MLNMLYDKDFLLKLDKEKNKTIYARVTALTLSESPIETIEGRVTGGSISLDGASALRRTCSLTIVGQDFDYNDYYWGLNTKFKLEIALENNIDSSMPKLIWFPMGIYVLTGFNTGSSTSNFTISINGKDKMCLLNGEVGGSLESSVDFGAIEEEDADGVWHIRKIPIPEIIRNAVHVYGREPYSNIIINDLDTYGLELLEYRYDVPMYLYRLQDSPVFINTLMENKTTKIYRGHKYGDGYIFDTDPCFLEDLDSNYLDAMTDDMVGSDDPLPVRIDSSTENYIITKVEFGQTAGYRATDLIYAGDLIGGIGESLTSILDKIKNMLVEFEYFYNLHGQFVFQKKRSFINTLWTPTGENGGSNAQLEESLMQSAATAYTFSGGELITAFNNNPNILNMRNDYSIWGERTSASGAAIPVHMRYAIDTKPTQYTSIVVDYNIDTDTGADAEVIRAYNQKYNTRLNGQQSTEYTTDSYDWREIIYQMAKDYYKYNHLDDFELRLMQANPQYPTGQTGYEQYYIDLEGFWRELYNPELQTKINELEYKIEHQLPRQISAANNLCLTFENSIREYDEKIKNETITAEEYNSYLETVLDYNAAMKLIKILDARLLEAQEDLETLYVKIEDYYYDSGEDRLYWNRNVFEKPELLNFWFDFLDTEGELQQFNTKVSGSRPKSINDTAVKSIYYRETPNVVFQTAGEDFNKLTGFKYIQIPETTVDTMFSISAQSKSAKERLDELLYQHGYCVESVSITAIPVYYLEPNTRIYIYDEKSKIDGDYIVSKITLPLAYNGTMSITATRAAEQIR